MFKSFKGCSSRDFAFISLDVTFFLWRLQALSQYSFPLPALHMLCGLRADVTWASLWLREGPLWSSWHCSGPESLGLGDPVEVQQSEYSTKTDASYSVIPTDSITMGDAAIVSITMEERLGFRRWDKNLVAQKNSQWLVVCFWCIIKEGKGGEAESTAPFIKEDSWQKGLCSRQWGRFCPGGSLDLCHKSRDRLSSYAMSIATFTVFSSLNSSLLPASNQTIRSST
jgi:hypothetical protein